MSDPWVLNVQNWLNTTYGNGQVAGWNNVNPDGVTGWQTIYGLTRALQHELGITALADNFGTATMTALKAFGDITPATTNQNIVNILIGALYCKGYNGGNGYLQGTWSQMTSDAIFKLQGDIGIPTSEAVSPKLFKALLNMDAFVRVGQGTNAAREVQQWMNATYLNQTWFDIVPCDGSFSRNIQVMLVYAIQTELAVTGANGNFGSGTRSAIKAKAPIKAGDSDPDGKHWIRLFQAAMRFNRNGTDFNGTFSWNDANVTYAFQTFAGLEGTSQGDYQTWCELLVSTGDPDRLGQACDTATILTPAQAAAIKNSGRLVVGRYLTGTIANNVSKALTLQELDGIMAAGLGVFPIFETVGKPAAYFNVQQGKDDANAALTAAKNLRFMPGTVIYFAVDFDATDIETKSSIIPYFAGVALTFADTNSDYQVGVYGPRNICTRLAEQQLASFSFVAGLSTGFSGNLGFPLPSEWLYNQISTITVGTGSGAVEIDNDIMSDLASGPYRTRAARPATSIAEDNIFGPATRAMLDYVLGVPRHYDDLGLLPDPHVDDGTWVTSHLSEEEKEALQVYLNDYAPYDAWKTLEIDPTGDTRPMELNRLIVDGDIGPNTAAALTSYIAAWAGDWDFALKGEAANEGAERGYDIAFKGGRVYWINVPKVWKLQAWLNSAYEQVDRHGGQSSLIPPLPFA